MALPLYRGLSTGNYLKGKQTFGLSNVDLVKRDLLNHIFTRPGERVMMPNFGTTIPDLVFEPLDDQTTESIRRQLEYVFEYDPRVNLITMNVFAVPEMNSIIASAVLYYVELDMTDRFDLNIDMNTTT